MKFNLMSLTLEMGWGPDKGEMIICMGGERRCFV